MLKKFLYLGAFCAIAMLASCGNKNNAEAEAAAAQDTTQTVVGEVVEGVTNAGDTVVAAVAEVTDSVGSAAQNAAQKVTDAVKN